MWKKTFIYRPTMQTHTTYKRIREIELPVGPQLDKSDRSMKKKTKLGVRYDVYLSRIEETPPYVLKVL